jgi:hypothetical protein
MKMGSSKISPKARTKIETKETKSLMEITGLSCSVWKPSRKSMPKGRVMK